MNRSWNEMTPIVYEWASRDEFHLRLASLTSQIPDRQITG